MLEPDDVYVRGLLILLFVTIAAAVMYVTMGQHGGY